MKSSFTRQQKEAVLWVSKDFKPQTMARINSHERFLYLITKGRHRSGRMWIYNNRSINHPHKGSLLDKQWNSDIWTATLFQSCSIHRVDRRRTAWVRADSTCWTAATRLPLSMDCHSSSRDSQTKWFLWSRSNNSSSRDSLPGNFSLIVGLTFVNKTYYHLKVYLPRLILKVPTLHNRHTRGLGTPLSRFRRRNIRTKAIPTTSICHASMLVFIHRSL